MNCWRRMRRRRARAGDAKGRRIRVGLPPAPRTIQVKLPRFPSTAIYAWWFDPRAKTAQPAAHATTTVCGRSRRLRQRGRPAMGAGARRSVPHLPAAGQSDGAPRLVYHPVRLDGAAAYCRGRVDPGRGVRFRGPQAVGVLARDAAVRQRRAVLSAAQVWRPDKDDGGALEATRSDGADLVDAALRLHGGRGAAAERGGNGRLLAGPRGVAGDGAMGQPAVPLQPRCAFGQV